MVDRGPLDWRASRAGRRGAGRTGGPADPAAAIATGGEWPQCATEGGKCYVPSGTLVRYGVGASWVYGTASGAFDCNNATFGDPAQGTRKGCYFNTPSVPRDWTRCAVEGGRCNLADSQMVRYGAGGAWLYNTAGSTVACTNATFSDPKPGSRKECFLGIPAPQGNWLRCALEGGKCNFVGKATVRYGSGDAWVHGSAADGIACTNAAFSDAKPGFRKECYFIGPTTTGNWLRCAVEGGRCNCAKPVGWMMAELEARSGAHALQSA